MIASLVPDEPSRVRWHSFESWVFDLPDVSKPEANLFEQPAKIALDRHENAFDTDGTS
jgi:hypothetical protein